MIVQKLRDTLAGLWSLLVGLKVTAVNFTRPQVTVHYPRRTVPTLEGYRGHIELVPNEENPFESKCIACKTCVRMCPTACIFLTSVKAEKKEGEAQEGTQTDAGDKPKTKKAPPRLTSFTLNYNYCSLCGLCVQSCPTDALRFSTDVYLAGFSREEFIFDLLARLHRQAEQEV